MTEYLRECLSTPEKGQHLPPPIKIQHLDVSRAIAHQSGVKRAFGSGYLRRYFHFKRPASNIHKLRELPGKRERQNWNPCEKIIWIYRPERTHESTTIVLA